MCRFKDEEEDEASCWVCVCVFSVHKVERRKDVSKMSMNYSGGIETGLQDPKIFFQLHAWSDIMICLVHAQVSRFGSDECPSTPNLPISQLLPGTLS